jgi:hypothetical protein
VLVAVSPAGKKQVPTMRLVTEFGYARTEDWQVVSLPAHGGVTAVILLPYGDLRCPRQATRGEGRAAVLREDTGALYFLARITNPVTPERTSSSTS